MRSRSFALSTLRIAGAFVGALALFFCVQGSASAATKTFDGSGNLSTAANWDANTLPTDGDTIVFDGTSTSNATWDATFASSYSNLNVQVAATYVGTITLGANAVIASSTYAGGTFNTAAYSLTANGDFTVAGGVVTSTHGSGVAIFNDDVNAVTGTFLIPYTTTVKGNWAIYSATIPLEQTNVNTIIFSSSTGSQYFKPGSGISYCGLTINNTAGGSSDNIILTSDTLTSFCAVTVTQGNLDFATNNITWTHDSTVTIADNAQAGLALGTPTYTFRNNISIGSSATVSTVSTSYTYEPQNPGTYTITSAATQVFNGTFTIDMSCGSISTTTFSGGFATTHLKLIDGIADFKTNNATLDADGFVQIGDAASACTPGTQLGLKWGTGQFNIGGNFIQKISASSMTTGFNTFVFDGPYDQIVSTTASMMNVIIRKSTGSLYPGTPASGTGVNVMQTWSVGNMTLATGTLNMSVINDPMTVMYDFLVSGASTSILLPNGSGNGVTFRGNVLMTAAGSFTAGTTTTTISTTTGSGAMQRVGASAGTMSLGPVAVSTTLILPEGMSLTAHSITGTTTLTRFNLQGGFTLTLSTGGGQKLSFNSPSDLVLSSSSTVVYTGSGTIGGVVMPTNVTVNASGATFTVSASTTIMGNFTVASGTTVVINSAIDFTIPSGYTVSNSGTITETGSFIHPNSYVRFVDSSGILRSAVTYTGGSLLYVEVKDEDTNLLGASAESLTAGNNYMRLYSNTGDVEGVTVTETAADSGVFRGVITVNAINGAVPGNGILEMTGNGTLSLAYVDRSSLADATTTTVAVASLGNTAPISGGSSGNLSGSVQINNGATLTSAQNVTLQLSATGATEMAISENPDFIGGIWEPYTSTKSFTLSSGAGSKTVYVKFGGASGAISTTVSASIAYAPAASNGTVGSTPTTPAPTVPNPGVVIPFGLNPGDLVKIDGNTAVYYIDPSGSRRPFPTEIVYLSWYGADFSKVKTITADQLASFALGKNMTIKPGMYLVKITTMPKVYAVTGDATLQWVETEARAIELFGSDWAKKVVDIPDAFFVNYTILSTSL